MLDLNTLDEFSNPIHNLKLNEYYAFTITNNNNISIKIAAIFIGYMYIENNTKIILKNIYKIKSFEPKDILYNPLTLTESDSAKDDPINYFDLDSNNNLISLLRICPIHAYNFSKLKLEKKLS